MNAEIASLRALLQEATPGPWATDGRFASQLVIGPDNRVVADLASCSIGKDAHVCTANGRLIAAMRNALPALLDRVEELEMERDDIWELYSEG